MIFSFWKLAYVDGHKLKLSFASSENPLNVDVEYVSGILLKFFLSLWYVNDDHLWNYFVLIFVDGHNLKLVCLLWQNLVILLQAACFSLVLTGLSYCSFGFAVWDASLQFVRQACWLPFWKCLQVLVIWPVSRFWNLACSFVCVVGQAVTKLQFVAWTVGFCLACVLSRFAWVW